MPLHDWKDGMGWEGVHHVWLVELLRSIKPQLPAGYRAFLGAPPTVAVGAPPEKADVAVHRWHEEEREAHQAGPTTESDRPEFEEELAVMVLEPEMALQIERHGVLIAAVELVSPRNKDRKSPQEIYLSRYAGYLFKGVHLLLIDVHPQPYKFSFADELARLLQIEQPPCPAPLAISFRVGEPAAAGGRLLGVWRRSLRAGENLPVAPLALSIEVDVAVDLETSYSRAAADAYLE